MTKHQPPRTTLLPTRTAIVLLLAIVTALGLAGLVWHVRGNAGESVLAGVAVLAAAINFFDHHLDHG